MHAIVTTTHGQQEGMEGLAAMAGEEMIDWFREAEGFEGMSSFRARTRGRRM